MSHGLQPKGMGYKQVQGDARVRVKVMRESGSSTKGVKVLQKEQMETQQLCDCKRRPLT